MKFTNLFQVLPFILSLAAPLAAEPLVDRDHDGAIGGKIAQAEESPEAADESATEYPLPSGGIVNGGKLTLSAQNDEGVAQFTADVVLSLPAIREALASQVATAMPMLAEQLPARFDWGNFRFSNLRPVYDGLSVSISGPRQLALGIRFHVDADRERLVWRWRGFHSGFVWQGDGFKNVASATLDAKLDWTMTSTLQAAPATFSVRAESLGATFHLRPFNGATSRRPMDKTLFEQTPQLLQQGAAERISAVADLSLEDYYFVSASDDAIMLKLVGTVAQRSR